MIYYIRTIHGTTAIEGNTLTEDQITALLEGKRIVAPQREIDEIKGAHREAKGEAYSEGKESRDKSRDKDANLIRREGGKKFGKWILSC